MPGNRVEPQSKYTRRCYIAVEISNRTSKSAKSCSVTRVSLTALVMATTSGSSNAGRVPVGPSLPLRGPFFVVKTLFLQREKVFSFSHA